MLRFEIKNANHKIIRFGISDSGKKLIKKSEKLSKSQKLSKLKKNLSKSGNLSQCY